jgi:hypothetical protein
MMGVVACLASALAIGGPREDVKDVAVLINDYYFDAQRAATIAAELRRDADAGAFDRLTDPDDLAVERSARELRLPPRRALARQHRVHRSLVRREHRLRR